MRQNRTLGQGVRASFGASRHSSRRRRLGGPLLGCPARFSMAARHTRNIVDRPIWKSKGEVRRPIEAPEGNAFDLIAGEERDSTPIP